MTVTAEGYCRFETVITMSENASTPNAQDSLYGKNFSAVANIGLYPTASVGTNVVDDIDVFVTDPTGRPVVGATVMITPACTNTSYLQFGTVNNVVGTAPAVTKGMTVVTAKDTNGNAVATFTEDTLTAGVGYDITFAPIAANGGFLAFTKWW